MDRFSKPLGYSPKTSATKTSLSALALSSSDTRDWVFKLPSSARRTQISAFTQTRKTQPKPEQVRFWLQKKRVLSKSLQELAPHRYRNVRLIPQNKLCKSDQPGRSLHFEELPGQKLTFWFQSSVGDWLERQSTESNAGLPTENSI